MLRLHKIVIALTLALACLHLGACEKPEDKQARFMRRGAALYAGGQFEKARLEFRNAARIAPLDPGILYHLGLVSEALDDAPRAIAYFQKAEQQDAHFAPAAVKITQYLLAAGHEGPARARVDRVLADDPGNADARALRAALRLRQKEYAAVERELNRAFAKDPGNVIGFTVLSGLRMAQGDEKAALAALEEGAKRNPRDLPLLLLKAAFHGKSNDLPKITETFQAIFARRPKDIRYRIQLAGICQKAGRPEQAEAVLRKAAADFPGDPDIRRRLAQFLDETRGMVAAEAEIRAWLKDRPKNGAPWLWLAGLYLRHGETDKAASLLEEISEKNDDPAIGLAARASLAGLRLRHGDEETAARLAGLVLAKDPDNAEALFLRARLAFRQGAYPKAVADLRAILRDQPDNGRVLRILAEVLLIQGKPDLAADTLGRILSIHPGDKPARLRLAQMQALQGDLSLARETAARVTQADPAYAVGQETAARLAIDAKDWDAANAAVKKLRALEGQEPVAEFLRGRILAGAGKSDEAAAIYRNVIQSDPAAPLAERALTALLPLSEKNLPELAAWLGNLSSAGPSILTTQGKLLLALGRPEEAAAILGRAMAQNPAFQEPYLVRAKILHRQKQGKEAIALLQKAEKAAPADPRAPMMMAEILAARDKVDEAVAVYDRLLARNPALDVAANNMAQLLADRRGGDPAAMEKARLAAERFAESENPLFLDTLGWVYFRAGDVARAAPVLERAIRLSAAPPPQMLYHYGALLLKTGRTEEGRRYLEQAVKPPAGYPGIEEAKRLLIRKE